MSVTIRPASEVDVEILTTVVIEATHDQGRLPEDFDEVDYRTALGAWTSEQIGGDGAGRRSRCCRSTGRTPAGCASCVVAD